MNYEEKYKEALKVIESLYNVVRYQSSSDALLTCQTIEKAFPELCESEDEKIRKELMEYITLYKDSLCESEYKSWISWLEKQKEKRYTIDVDKMVIKYSQTKEKVGGFGFPVNCQIRAYRQGVNDALSLLVLEKHGEQKLTPKFKIGDTIHKIGENTVFPMTIEKIEDGDYVCNNSHSFINIKFQDDYELVKQKPIWSEEDDIRLNHLIGFIQKYGFKYYASTDKVINWLKSLKPQSHWKPSKEQMEALKYVVDYFGELTGHFAEYEEIKSLYNDLKSL